MLPAALLVVAVLQQAPEVTAWIRPQDVRVGARVVLTVRVTYPAEAPEDIVLAHAPEVDLIDVVDRERMGRWERDFILVPTGSGEAEWLVEVTFEDRVLELPVAAPRVGAVGAWRRQDGEVEPVPPAADGSRERTGDPDRVLPEGHVPDVAGRGGWTPGGGLPAPGGWAARAHLDPWWDEVVPQEIVYDVAARDPATGFVIEAAVWPRTVYVGQQLGLWATVSLPPSAAQLRARYWAPQPPGFQRVPLGAGRHPAVRDGDLQLGTTFQSAYFPTEPGPVAFPTGGVFVPGWASFEGPVTSVTVLPIPRADAPEGWAGAVGRYRIAAWVEPARITWGDAALLQVEVSGVGNVRALPPPLLPRVYGGRLTPYRDHVRVEARDGVAGGVKVFTYLVTPLEPASIVIDPFVFPYFDPWVGGFGVAATGELEVEVGN